MGIADTGRFWEILVIPVLQIVEDSGKYWLYQYCRYWKILVIPVLQILEDSGKYWKISYEVAECTCILFFLSGISGIEVSVSCHKKI
jgi:hypothetical protein